MPESKVCPNCGELCELALYVTVGAFEEDSPTQMSSVWECPEGCGWVGDAEE